MRNVTSGRVLRVRRGRSPNCSASGSVVGLALASVITAAAVVNTFADRFSRWVRRDRAPSGGGSGGDPFEEDGDPVDPGPPADDVPRLRPEADGALLAWSHPPAVLWLDHDAADAARAAGAVTVGGGAAPPGALSAPVEVHLALTTRCPVTCDGCYLDAGPHGADPSRDALVADLEALAGMGVFEVALGGGEALLRDDVFEILADVRARGLVPNLTISGFGLTPARARRLAGLVGQVNVSLDGLTESYQAVRGWRGADLGLRAIRRLREAGVPVGVNTVLSRKNVDDLERLGTALAELGVVEWQWLRFKPAGRGVVRYADHALDPATATRLWPRLLAIEARTGLSLRIDCALVPFLVAHGPPVEALDRLAVAGCPGGDSLWARTADGRWTPCSFADAGAARVGDAARAWHVDPTLRAWRERASAPPEPCASCAYRHVCRGGCRVVAAHVTGDPLAPDPECPRVLGHR